MEKCLQYRIKTPTMAIYSSGGQRRTVTVPTDVVVTIAEDPRQGDGLISVIWNHQEYIMFTQDLRERAEPLC